MKEGLLHGGLYAESRHASEIFAPYAKSKMLTAHLSIILGKHYAMVLGMRRELFSRSARVLLLDMH